jgi:hypothetical protein
MTVVIDYFLLVGFALLLFIWIKINLVLILKCKTKFVKIKLLDHDVLVIISGPFFICWRLRFLLAGISSYFKINLLPLQNTTELVFIPQGLVMMFMEL